ncbi:MAG: hypothetical protein QGH06_09140 [Lutibacter sp.]|nr:hypothetical protein [Lutibacter sp.]
MIGSATGIPTYLYHQRFVPSREMGAYLVVILFSGQGTPEKSVDENILR